METFAIGSMENLHGMIITLRGVQVMLDADIATLYGVETKSLNQAVKRNSLRFPDHFRFQLSEAEKKELVTICDRFNNLKHSTALPYAFAEQGVAMLSAVLRSETAIRISIAIMQAFVDMRRFLADNNGLLQRLNNLEMRQLSHEINTDGRFEQIFKALESGNPSPAQGIFFEGQVFDAYVFVNELLREAKRSIVLIDNYIDDSVLLQLSKRRDGVSATILTKHLSAALLQDLEKHNAQYPPIMIREFPHSHDRFLILDNETVYHIGASLKDLGKKWFAFSLMDKAGLVVMQKLGVMPDV